MTKQDVFDKVWDYFIAQERPLGKNGQGTCLYRTADGKRCAVGLFLSDKVASTMGLIGVDQLFSGCYLHKNEQAALAELPLNDSEHAEFWSGLQHAHDAAAQADRDGEDKEVVAREERSDLMKGLIDFAKMYGLSVPAN